MPIVIFRNCHLHNIFYATCFADIFLFLNGSKCLGGYLTPQKLCLQLLERCSRIRVPQGLHASYANGKSKPQFHERTVPPQLLVIT